MGDGTAIEWTDATWNPVIGCSRTSPGCDNCYAIGVVHRQMSPQHVGLTVKPDGGRVDWTGEVRPAPQVLSQPLRWKRPRRIFVNSLSDLFHADLPDEEIAKVFAVMALAPQHTFQVLTKRSKRMREWVNACAPVEGFVTHNGHKPSKGGIVVGEPGRWPLPNVWLGVSIESDAYAFRADHLRATPASVRWISAEPLLGPLPSVDLAGIDWLVAGGESGAGARPMDPAWVRELRDRCAESGTAFLFKQWGAWAPDGAGVTAAGRPWKSPDGKAEVLIGSPDMLHMRQIMRRVGKKAAGRELDGRTWDEYPAPENEVSRPT